MSLFIQEILFLRVSPLLIQLAQYKKKSESESEYCPPRLVLNFAKSVRLEPFRSSACTVKQSKKKIFDSPIQTTVYHPTATSTATFSPNRNYHNNKWP